ncbi:MAG: hypothetical protein NTW96_13990 [Planctomycetia bacterium]|nr:hypothetical protein [Planctomycetia bacterium]
MILRSLAVENWRCFVNRLEVGPLGDRINVIHGRNGIGKSTLMGAMVRGLLDNHAVGGQASEALRPKGRPLNPRVTIEFEHDGQRLLLAKQFLGSASAELKRFEGGKFVRLAEGEAADNQVREMLGGMAPGRGLTDVRHWGMSQVLWAPQDGLKLPELATTVAGAIRASLGAQMSDARQDAVEKRIDEAYRAVYTPKGKLKGGKDAPAVVGMEAELADAQRRCLELRERVAAFETAGRRIEDLRARRDQATRDEDQLAKDLAAAGAKAKAYAEVRAKRDQQKGIANTAESRYSQTKRLVDEIQSLRAELGQAEMESRRLETEVPAGQKEVNQRAEEADRARAELDVIRRRRQEVVTAKQTAQIAARFVESRRKLVEAERLIGQLTDAQDKLDGLARQRGELIAPDTNRLREIQSRINRRETTGARLAAAMITVSIVPEREIDLEVLAGEEPGRRTISPEHPGNLQGAPAVEFHIPGVGTFRATGPTDSSLDTLRDELAETEQKLDDFTRAFGTRDLVELQRLHDRAVAMDKQTSDARLRYETLLGDRRVEAIEQDRSAAAEAVEQALAEHADWAGLPPDADRLDADARRIEQAFVADVEKAELRRDDASAAMSVAEKDQARRQEKLAATADRVRDLRKRLDERTADGRDDAGREAELTRWSIEFRAANADVAAAEEQLRTFDGDPRGDVEILDRQLADARRRLRDAEEELNQTKGRLQEIAADAPYSKLAEVEETIGRLNESIDAERFRNDAVRLLRETVRECRDSAVGAVLGPVERRASETLRRITGPGLGAIRLDESFLPDHVAPESIDATVAIDEISGGEREQVHLAVRLALAHGVFQNERQLVVLDDVLTATDSARFARVLPILEEAAERFQILILTCHPERYQPLSDAKFFDLEEKVNGPS